MFMLLSDGLNVRLKFLFEGYFFFCVYLFMFLNIILFVCYLLSMKRKKIKFIFIKFMIFYWLFFWGKINDNFLI